MNVCHTLSFPFWDHGCIEIRIGSESVLPGCGAWVSRSRALGACSRTFGPSPHLVVESDPSFSISPGDGCMPECVRNAGPSHHQGWYLRHVRELSRVVWKLVYTVTATKGGQMLCTWSPLTPVATLRKGVLSHQDKYQFKPNEATYFAITLFLFFLKHLF